MHAINEPGNSATLHADHARCITSYVCTLGYDKNTHVFASNNIYYDIGSYGKKYVCYMYWIDDAC